MFLNVTSINRTPPFGDHICMHTAGSDIYMMWVSVDTAGRHSVWALYVCARPTDRAHLTYRYFRVVTLSDHVPGDRASFRHVFMLFAVEQLIFLCYVTDGADAVIVIQMLTVTEERRCRGAVPVEQYIPTPLGSVGKHRMICC